MLYEASQVVVAGAVVVAQVEAEEIAQEGQQAVQISLLLMKQTGQILMMNPRWEEQL